MEILDNQKLTFKNSSMYVQKRNQNLIKKLSEIDKISGDRLKTKFNITKLVTTSSGVCTVI